ncbi:mechanosensitive ion channel family protein [Thermosulfuriphilus sp.]
MKELVRSGLYGGALLLFSVVLALLVHRIIFALLERISQKTESPLDDLLLRHLKRPSRLLLLIMVLFLALAFIPFPQGRVSEVRHGLILLLIASLAWFLIEGALFLEDLILIRYPLGVRDNLLARKIYTQVRVIKRIVIVLSIFLAFSLALLTFPRIRQIGISLLASAGLVGLVLGMAAQKTLASLIAGFQLAITQPIRIDDVVIVEGEWGRVEEITLTYVVVRIWDLRRLIVPISYFLERPFENWTRVSADILATVYIYADYSLPIGPVREALYRILKSSPLWDGKVWGLQVTEATEKTIELRALMSAADSSSAWDLRCEVREGLIAFIRDKYPQCLPRIRAEVGEKGQGV